LFEEITNGLSLDSNIPPQCLLFFPTKQREQNINNIKIITEGINSQ
jgi:hypothetical protein